MTHSRAARALLVLVVLAFLVVGVLYAVYTPAWQAPDEPAHYNYVAQIAGGGCCPVIAPGDWDTALIDEVASREEPPPARLSRLEYEDHQPPLYYLLATPVFALTGGSLLALRLVSVVLGAGVVVMAYLVVARLLGSPPLALAAAVFVAFIPQHVAILSSVNNDALAELVLGALLVLALGYLGADEPARRPHPALLGLLAGLAFLTKLTVYGPAVLVVALAIAFRAAHERRPVRWFAGQAAWAGGVAVALGALWWGRNVAVYGWPDLFAQTAHEAAVVGQLRTADLIAEIGAGAYAQRLLSTTFHSFFGQFGWMAVPMPPRIYWLIGAFLLELATGLALLAATRRGAPPLPRTTRAGLWVLAALVGLAVVQFGYYNLTFVQFQGRYLYPALIPLGLAAAAGLWGWARFVARFLPARWHGALAWLPLVVMGWLPLLAVYALFWILVPNLG